MRQLFFVLSFFSAVHLAIGQVGFGVTAGVGSSTTGNLGNGPSGSESDGAISYRLGVQGNAALSKKFSLIFGLDFFQRGGEPFPLNGVGLGILPTYRVSRHLYFFLGPEASYISPTKKNVIDNGFTKDFDLGLRGGIGYGITDDMDIGLSYYHGLPELYDLSAVFFQPSGTVQFGSVREFSLILKYRFL